MIHLEQQRIKEAKTRLFELSGRNGGKVAGASAPILLGRLSQHHSEYPLYSNSTFEMEDNSFALRVSLNAIERLFVNNVVIIRSLIV